MSTGVDETMKGRVALITGGGGGMGGRHATVLADRGADIILLDRDQAIQTFLP